MKKVLAIFGVLMLVFMLSGCGEHLPKVIVRQAPVIASDIYIDLGKKDLRLDRFERFDDETGTKLVLYFKHADES